MASLEPRARVASDPELRRPVKVAALIPAYQAAAHLGEVLLGLRAQDIALEILVVDDGSRDATAQVARQFGARVLSFAGNRGKGHALIAGFRELAGSDAVITLDADGQHPPEWVPRFVEEARRGGDLVLGCRERSADMPGSRRWANWISSAWTSWLAEQAVPDSQCGYRLYRRSLLEATPLTPGRYEVETEIVVRSARLGVRIAPLEIPTVYRNETSQIRAMRDVPRIAATLMRLSLERAFPPPAMQDALRRVRPRG